jgi:pimeloyl-ACP methyl ester carboxylesterase
MTDFLEAKPEGGVTENTPAILLVHGFGAFAEHWRRNISVLASKGYQCVSRLDMYLRISEGYTSESACV